MAHTVGGIFGDPGAGKTFQMIDTAIRYCQAVHGDDFLIGFYDFDNQPVNRAVQCINEFYPDFRENFDIVGVLQTGSKGYTNKSSKRSLFGELDEGASRIDYVKTYEYLHKSVFPHYMQCYQEYDFLLVDAIFPVIRKNIGKEVWKASNPERGEPTLYDWAAINPIESITFNKFVIPIHGCDDPHNIPVIMSGVMSDEYQNSVKVGQTISCDLSILKSMTYYVELSRAAHRRSRSKRPSTNDIEVTCSKSNAMPWKDSIIPFGERDLLTLLIENNVVNSVYGD